MASLWNDACRWTRARLPLLAGDDLRGPDRRQVERHLIGCASCRERLEAHRRDLDVLALAASVSPVATDGPSLWPALARQLHEHRHPVPRTFALGLGSGWRLPARGLALAAGALVAVGLTGVVYHAGLTPIEHARGLLTGRPTLSKKDPAKTEPPLPLVEPDTKPLSVADEETPKPADSPSIDTGGTR